MVKPNQSSPQQSGSLGRGYRVALGPLVPPPVVVQCDDPPSEIAPAETGQSWDHSGLVPHRRKGRLGVALVLAVIALVTVWAVWEAVFRYHAYGIIDGHLVAATSPQAGQLNSIAVIEGQRVVRGQVLAELTNTAMDRQLQSLTSELELARAQLETDQVSLEWRRASQADQFYESLGEYHTLRARFEIEQARLEEMQITTATTRTMHAASAATDHELRIQEVTLHGQQRQVADLAAAVGDLADRVEGSRGLITEAADPLAAARARVHHLTGEVNRMRQQLAECVVRSPVDGIVVEQHLRVGEHSDASQPLISILDEASLRAIVYVRQPASERLAPGDRVSIQAEPTGTLLRAQVERLDARFTRAGPSIARWYRAGEPLLRVYLLIEPDDTEPITLRPGQIVKLPRGWR